MFACLFSSANSRAQHLPTIRSSIDLNFLGDGYRSLRIYLEKSYVLWIMNEKGLRFSSLIELTDLVLWTSVTCPLNCWIAYNSVEIFSPFAQEDSEKLIGSRSEKIRNYIYWNRLILSFSQSGIAPLSKNQSKKRKSKSHIKCPTLNPGLKKRN